MDKNKLIQKIKDEYISKQELIEIAKSLKLKTTGLKLELKNNILLFLEKRIINNSNTRKTIDDSNVEYDIKDIIPEGFKWSYKNRDFYKKHLGSKFKPFYRFQLYIRENKNISFEESFIKYKELLYKEKNEKQEILPQFEYMQYTRDFFEDEINKNRTKKDCIKAWKYKKGLVGISNKYERSDLDIFKK